METKITLPSGILGSDLVMNYPEYGVSNKAYNKWREGDGKLVEPRELRLFYTERFGWVITTLFISSGSRQGATDRYYGIDLKGQQVRVGKGPHVKKEITIYMRANRMKVLQMYLDLYNSGLEQAHDTRDRISTRRGLGIQRRYSSFF